MSRSIRLIIAASLILAVGNSANLLAQQDNNPAASPANSSAPAGSSMAKLQAENAALKKQVADAARTIATLQAQLAKASAEPVPAVPAQAIDASTNAAPAGPLKALPLDSTNAIVTATAPGTPDAGPSRTYTVVKGDKIWTIAKKMYPGHTKEGVDKIQEANKDAIGNKPLKIGQVLIIPQ
jgi:nucleoid-associated protein YgaU